jgi:HlyD family secretion protein
VPDQGIIALCMSDDNPLPQPPALRDFDREVARVNWRAWAALGGLGAVIAGLIVWSVVGDIPTRVKGSCIIMHPTGVVDVTAEAPGRVAALLVRPGEQVKAGQEVAVIAAPELFERLLAAQQAVADREAEVAAQRTDLERSSTLSVRSLAEQREALALKQTSDRKRIAVLEQQQELNVRLRADGLLTARSLEAARLDLADARSVLAETDRKLAAVEKLSVDFQRKSAGSLAVLEQRLAEAVRARDVLMAQDQASTRLRARSAGRVVEIKAALDSAVKRDTPVVSIERLDQSNGQLEAVMFVSAADGKKIAAGNIAEITPSHARREEHGYMQAKVVSASAYPATPQGLMNRITNPELMRELAHGTATYEVRIGLQPAPPGGAVRNPYQWSNSAGRDIDVSSGSLCLGQVLVRHERPISLVLPIFRSTVSGNGHGG